MARLPSEDDIKGGGRILDGGGVASYRVERPEQARPDTSRAVAINKLGEVMGQTSDKIAHILEKETERTDTIRAEDAFNQLRETQLDLTAGKENGVNRIKGGDAVNQPVLETFTAKFNDRAKALEETLGSDRQREKFRHRTDIARAQFQGHILEHVGKETDHYAKAVYQQTLDTETRNIGEAPQDELVAAMSFERVSAAAAQEAKRQGLDPETATAKAHDALWTARLHAWRVQDPVGALKSFQDNALAIGPNVRATLAESLFKDAAPVLAANINDAGGPPVTAGAVAAVGRKDFDRNFNTVLTSAEEEKFQKWKEKNAPNDSGADYDLRGAFKAGMKPGEDGHWSDEFKKPNHPTFSNQSRYAPYGNPGSWAGKWDAATRTYTPPEGEDKFTPGKEQPRGVRNNNPGNIIAGPTQWAGQIEGADPKYASFATPQAGIRALGRNLLAYGSKGIDTVEGIVSRWAPSTENQTAEYVKKVAADLGVDPREPLNLKDRKVLTALATSIIQQENGSQPYSPETISAGIESAVTGKAMPYEAKRNPPFSVASVSNMTASDAINVVTGNQVIDRLPADQKIAVFQTARSQANQGAVQAREALRGRVTDTTAAFERGLDAPNPPSRTELITAFGQFDGERIAGEIDTAREFGKDVRSVQSLPATQQAALLASRAPEPGDGFANAQRRHEALARAIDNVAKERAQDPALSVLRNSPQVQSAYKAFVDRLASGQDEAAGAQAYATATLAEQQRLEVSNPQVLTKDMVDQIAKRFAAPPANGENVSSVMSGMVEQWGRYWPQVGAQLKGKVPPEATVIGLGVTPEAESILAEASKLKPEQLRQGIAEPDVKDLRERVRKDLEPLQRSLAWQGGGVETYDNYADSAEKIAVMLMQKGMKPKDASAKAVESIAGFKYQFEDTWRVPKTALGGTSTVNALRAGALASQYDIGSNKPELGEKVELAVPRAPAGVRPADAEAQWRDTIRANGFWVTSPGDGGLTLYVKSGLGAQPVLNSAGQPVRRSWSDLAYVGNSVRAATFSDIGKRKP